MAKAKGHQHYQFIMDLTVGLSKQLWILLGSWIFIYKYFFICISVISGLEELMFSVEGAGEAFFFSLQF